MEHQIKRQDIRRLLAQITEQSERTAEKVGEGGVTKEWYLAQGLSLGAMRELSGYSIEGFKSIMIERVVKPQMEDDGEEEDDDDDFPKTGMAMVGGDDLFRVIAAVSLGMFQLGWEANREFGPAPTSLESVE